MCFLSYVGSAVGLGEGENMKEFWRKREMGRGIRKSNRGGEYDQSTLYACAEIS
jgi:hypothetical protein